MKNIFPKRIPNKRVQGTRHKVSGPLTRDVGKYKKEKTMKTVIHSLIAILIWTACAYAQGSYRQVGNTLYGSDGSSYRQVGNTVYGSDGSSYRQIGNTTYSSDGSSFRQIGNTTYGSDGSSYRQIGNTTYGSDGSSMRQIGNTYYINP